MKSRILVVVLLILTAVIALAVIDFLILKYRGTPVSPPNIPRQALHIGTQGKVLNYVVMGDSTSIGQGAAYTQSYALQSAEYLGRRHQVTFLNVGVSGARAADVLHTQTAKAISAKPDIVLIAVGANDVTHLTNIASVRTSLTAIVSAMRTANPKVQIIVTGSPAMGAVPRLPWPLKQLAGQRTIKLNKMAVTLSAQNKLIFAPIAAKTGAAFAADPTLFAADRFHPNGRGYALWIPVIDQALDTAVAQIYY